MVGAEPPQALLEFVGDRLARRDSGAPACRPDRRSGCPCRCARPARIWSPAPPCRGGRRSPCRRSPRTGPCRRRARCRSGVTPASIEAWIAATDAASSVPPHIQPPIAQVPRPTATAECRTCRSGASAFHRDILKSFYRLQHVPARLPRRAPAYRDGCVRRARLRSAAPFRAPPRRRSCVGISPSSSG